MPKWGGVRGENISLMILSAATPSKTWLLEGYLTHGKQAQLTQLLLAAHLP